MLRHLKPSDIEAVQDASIAVISGLSHDAKIELVALMWLGRGDSGKFDDLLARAEETSDENDAEYIADQALALRTYLRDGLEAILGVDN